MDLRSKIRRQFSAKQRHCVLGALKLTFLIAGNLDAERFKKLRPVEGVSLRFKLSGLRRQLTCLSHG